MELESYFDFIDANVIRIKGHRVDIAHILAYYQEGYSPEAISLELPTLSLEQIHATITYYLHNKTIIDTYLSRQRAYAQQLMRQAAQREPSPIVQRIRALRAEQTPRQQS